MTSLSPTSPAPAFWDRKAPGYAKKPIADPAAYGAKLAKLRALLSPSDRVLEIGCGTGSTALTLAPHLAHITATDISGAMIEIAQAKLGPDAPANVTFRQADAMARTDGAPFDAVFAFSLLHLVDDLPAVLSHVHGQIKPGGLFLSKTVCLGETSIFLRAFVTVLLGLGIAPKLLFLDTSELVAAIRAAGFEVEEITHFGAKRMSPFIVARRL